MLKLKDVYRLGDNAIFEICHYEGDALQFAESYVVQGREGNKGSKIFDEDGKPLMDNGEPATYVPATLYDEAEYVCPSGRTWARESSPRLQIDTILTLARKVHAEWKAGEYTPDGSEPELISGQQKDKDGVDALVERFQSVIGTTYDS
tara:strand:- start:821 stop:1264 length:444 start_codon:yes stop_codon:yes gene_type:complete